MIWEILTKRNGEEALADWRPGAVVELQRGGFFVRIIGMSPTRTLDGRKLWVVRMMPLLLRTIVERLTRMHQEALENTTDLGAVEIALHVGDFGERARKAAQELEEMANDHQALRGYIQEVRQI